MNRASVLLLALILVTATTTITAKPVSSAEAKENTWTTKTPMPDGVSIVKAAVANGKIYVMGYLFNYEYDPATDTWTPKTPMPTPRNSATFAIAACENKIYAIGGNNGENGYHNYLSTNEAYDPSTDTWETKKPMPTSREKINANVVDGKIYIIGGVTDNHSSIDITVNEVYNPVTNTWTAKQSTPIAVQNYASAVVDMTIFIMRGYSLQIYDAENDTWIVGASIPISIEGGTATATSGVLAPKRIYVIGGGHTITWNDVRVYDPTLGNWSFGAPMPTNRTGHAVTTVNDTIYVLGGAIDYQGAFPVGTYRYTSAVEQYTPLGYGTIPSVTTNEPESFPTTLVITASGASAFVIGLSVLLYFKKRKQKGRLEKWLKSPIQNFS